MQSVHVIGLGVDHQDLPKGISRRIEDADVLVGGIRLLEAFKNHPAVKIAVKSPLDKVVTRIKQKMEALELRFGRNTKRYKEALTSLNPLVRELVDAVGAETTKQGLLHDV